MLRNPTSPESIEKSVLRRIRTRRRDAVVVPADFFALGSRQAIDLALHRLERKGQICRLARGLYTDARPHPVLGDVPPSVDAIARALAGRDRTRLQPAGAYAANLLGLSQQVPAKVVFLTDGPSRSVNIGTLTIQLRQTTPRYMAGAGKLSGLLVQAFRHLGKSNITPRHLAHLKRTVPAAERQALLRDLKLAPAWMHPLFRDLAEG